MQQHPLNWLKLMQIADSALPIGALAHSFGLEMLVQDVAVTVEQLSIFLQDYLMETGTIEANFCLKLYQSATLDDVSFEATWLRYNSQLDALKQARESREASAALGRRFLQLVITLETMQESHFRLEHSIQIAKKQRVGIHHCAAFGLVCGMLEIPAELAVSAFLQQSMTSLVSACQRLMPLGQTQASQLLWDIKPTIINVVQHSLATIVGDIEALPPVFTASIETASMRHPDLTTRLFIS